MVKLQVGEERSGCSGVGTTEVWWEGPGGREALERRGGTKVGEDGGVHFGRP